MAGPISEAESSVMEALWEARPRTAEDVVAALRDRQAWREATVKTLLNRLLKKGAICAAAIKVSSGETDGELRMQLTVTQAPARAQ
ncbi:MAG: BlaI/MecI/CopY family transcriptional regulator [Telluria sp.]